MNLPMRVAGGGLMAVDYSRLNRRVLHSASTEQFRLHSRTSESTFWRHQSGHMRPRFILIVLLAAGAAAALVAVIQPRHNAATAEPRQAPSEIISNAPEAVPSAVPQITPPVVPRVARKQGPKVSSELAAVSATNKLERLEQTRERFRALATGEPVTALKAARQIADETERETALLALVTQWTHGELRSPRERAEAIARYGVEAGLGMELTGNPELALSWANEITGGSGRLALLTQTAISLTATDPAAAFALADQFTENQQTNFFNTVFAGWGGKDTEAALQWANQLPDAEREAAVQAIRTEAPVGIGTAIGMKDGVPVVQTLLPGTPAELSGQIHPGDRILALAQGDNAFVDAHNYPLADLVQMIRGAPGTTLQLQILPADAPPGSAPQTISIIRDQLKFKR